MIWNLKKGQGFNMVVVFAISALLMCIISSVLILNKYQSGAEKNHYSLTLANERTVIEGMDFSGLERFREDFPETELNFYSKGELSVATEYNQTSTTVYGTDEYFLNFNKYPLIRGSFFINRDIEQQEQFVVISRVVAKALFNNYDVIGREVQIRGETFTVIGVLEATKLLPLNPFYENEYIVIIPFNKFEQLLPTHKVVHFEILSKEAFPKNKLNNWLNDQGVESWRYEMEDISKINLVFMKNIRIFIFIMGVLVLFEIAIILLKSFKRLIKYLKESHRKYYVWQWLKNDYYKLLLIILGFAGIVVVMIVLWRGIIFEFHFGIYYDGSYPIRNLGDFIKWSVIELNNGDFTYRTSTYWLIKVLGKVRNYALVLLLIFSILAHYKIVRWLKNRWPILEI